MNSSSPTPSSVWAGPLRLATVGSLAIILLAAFEEMAIATVMPRIADDLHGQHLYSLSLAAPMATAIIGMVAVGGWCDRRGPKGPYWFGAATFAAGLACSGLAPTMEFFTVGRLLQGLGAGAISVTVYVLVARIYPMQLHAQIFGLFATCWVIPSLVGPFIAGAVATVFSWHWLFLGVFVLACGACGIMLPELRRLRRETPSDAAESPWRLMSELARAATIALAVLAIGFLGSSSAWSTILLAGLVIVILVLIRPLLPPGAFRIAVGLPAVIVLRGLIAASDFGAEAYLPLLFNKVYGLDLTLSGLALTVSALTWALSSWMQGKYFTDWTDRRLLAFAAFIIVVSIASVTVATALLLPVATIIAAWGVSGFGMGLAYPRMSAMVIRLSQPDRQGFNSAAINMADSTGAALGVAGLGVMQHGGEVGPLVAVFAVATVIAACAWAVSFRAGTDRE